MTHTSLKYLTLLASLMAMQSFAQTPQELAVAQARYKQEVIDCTVNSPVVGKENCLKEARNTLADFKHGRMNETWQASDLHNPVFEKRSDF